MNSTMQFLKVITVLNSNLPTHKVKLIVTDNHIQRLLQTCGDKLGMNSAPIITN